MKLLLDTHAFLWWDGNRRKLSKTALNACLDERNTLFLSAISVWEILVKQQLGKLEAEIALRQVLREQQDENGLRMISFSAKHALVLEKLPNAHRDPFDRMIIAQAFVEKLTIVSVDSVFSNYPVQVLW